MDIFSWDVASCVQMVVKGAKCTKYLNTLQKVSVNLLILLVICSVMMTRTLLTSADTNTALIGSGRIVTSKIKEQPIYEKPDNDRT